MFGSLFYSLLRFVGLNMGDSQELVRCQRRCGHITFTDGENLYVWGGHSKDSSRAHNTPIEDVWIFRPKFDAWVRRKSKGQFPLGTSGCSWGLVEPFLYVYCGHHTYQGHTSSLHKMHLHTLEWTVVQHEGKAISPRDKAASWVWDDKLWCFGGYGHNPQLTGIYEGQGNFTHGENSWDSIGWNNQLVMYDLSTSKWSSPECQNIAAAPLPRAAHAAVVLGKNKVYIFGGRHKENRMNDLHCLDMDTLTWSGRLKTRYQEPQGRSWHSLSALDDSRMLLYGGFSQDENVLSDLWMYSLKEEMWTQLMEKSRYPRGWHTAAVTSHSDLLIFGGFNRNILSTDFDFHHISDVVIKFQFNPSSFKQLCLDYVYRHLDSKQWGELPKNLRDFLLAKKDLQAPWEALEASEKDRYGEHVVKGFSPPELTPGEDAADLDIFL